MNQTMNVKIKSYLEQRRQFWQMLTAGSVFTEESHHNERTDKQQYLWILVLTMRVDVLVPVFCFRALTAKFTKPERDSRITLH